MRSINVSGPNTGSLLPSGRARPGTSVGTIRRYILQAGDKPSETCAPTRLRQDGRLSALFRQGLSFPWRRSGFARDDSNQPRYALSDNINSWAPQPGLNALKLWLFGECD